MKEATYDEARAPHESKGVFWKLLRQDAVRRSLRWSAPIALVLGLVVRTAGGDALDGWRQLPFYAQHNEFIYLFVQVWLAVLFAVIIAHFNSRCSSLSLGLPIGPRTLWFSRVVSIAGAGLIPVAVVVAATASADPTRSFGLDVPLLPLGARTAAGFVLAVVLFQLPSPGVHRIAGKKSYVLYVGLVSVAVLAYTITTPGPWIWTAAPVVAAAAIGWVVGSRLPSVFNLAGAEWAPSESEKPAAAVKSAGGQLLMAGRSRSRLWHRWRLLRIVWQENLNTWPIPLMTLFIYLTVWLLTSLYYKVYHNPHEYITLMLWCWLFVCQSVKRLKRLDCLPIKRSVAFYSVIAFMAIPAGLGLLTGYLVDYRLVESPMTAVCYCDHTVRVPYDAWEVAWSGEAPEVSSPRGETYTPHAARLVKRWFDVAVYNPFEPGKKSSPEFIAFQIDRAVARVHSPREVSPAVSDVAGDSSFVNALKEGKYTVAASLRKDSDLRIRTNAVIIMLWFVVFVVVNTIWWKRYQPEADIVRTRWFAILFFGIPYTLLFGIAVLTAKGILNDWAILAFQMIALRALAEAIPLSTGMLWALTVVVAVTSIIVLGKRYDKAEAPTQRSGKHLLSEY
jgi:hypothetical protein